MFKQARDLTLRTADIGPEDGKLDDEEPKSEEVLNTGAQPKSLTPSFGGDEPKSTTFWTWLWRSCMHVGTGYQQNHS